MYFTLQRFILQIYIICTFSHSNTQTLKNHQNFIRSIVLYNLQHYDFSRSISINMLWCESLYSTCFFTSPLPLIPLHFKSPLMWWEHGCAIDVIAVLTQACSCLQRGDSHCINYGWQVLLVCFLELGSA